MANATIVSFHDPAFRDELSDLVRDGAPRIIRQAVEAELKAFLEAHGGERDAEGRRAVVRNGYQPERDVLTGAGPVSVQMPKTRDRAGGGRCFRSELLPPYLKKATYQDKYPKAVECLAKDRAELLAFYDFPAAHRQHIRTTNPIESTFATIRLRTRKTRNSVSAKSGLSLMHQLAMSAQKRWRRLRGFQKLADVVAGIKFIDGVGRRRPGWMG